MTAILNRYSSLVWPIDIITLAFVIQTNPAAGLDSFTKFVTMFYSYPILLTPLTNIAKVRFCVKNCFK